MAKKDSNTTADNSELDALLQSFLDSPPELTGDQIDRLEAAAQDQAQSEGIARRLAFVMLSKTGRELVEATEDREGAIAFAASAHSIKFQMDRLKALTGIMERAHLRVTMALCERDDMDAIMEEAAT